MKMFGIGIFLVFACTAPVTSNWSPRGKDEFVLTPDYVILNSNLDLSYVHGALDKVKSAIVGFDQLIQQQENAPAYKKRFLKVVFDATCERYKRLTRKAAAVGIIDANKRLRRGALGATLLKTVGAKVIEAGVKEVMASARSSSVSSNTDPPFGFMGNMQSLLYGTMGV